MLPLSWDKLHSPHYLRLTRLTPSILWYYHLNAIELEVERYEYII